MNSPATSKPIHDALNPRKAIKSMLDPFKEQMLQMDGDNKTIAEIHTWLGTQSVSCSPSNVQQYLATRRAERKQEGMLGHLVSGAKTGQEVERLLARHPAPSGQGCKRFHTNMAVTVRKERRVSKGQITNISQSGAFLKVAPLPPLGSVIELDILVPGQIVSDPVQAFVVHPAPNRGVGVQFIGASDLFREHLDDYLGLVR